MAKPRMQSWVATRIRPAAERDGLHQSGGMARPDQAVPGIVPWVEARNMPRRFRSRPSAGLVASPVQCTCTKQNSPATAAAGSRTGSTDDR